MALMLIYSILAAQFVCFVKGWQLTQIQQFANHDQLLFLSNSRFGRKRRRICIDTN